MQRGEAFPRIVVLERAQAQALARRRFQRQPREGRLDRGGGLQSGGRMYAHVSDNVSASSRRKPRSSTGLAASARFTFNETRTPSLTGLRWTRFSTISPLESTEKTASGSFVSVSFFNAGPSKSTWKSSVGSAPARTKPGPRRV